MLRPILVASFVLGASAQSSGSLPPAPHDRVILTVSGDIGCTNQGEDAVFDLSGLDSLGSDVIHTTTKWTEGRQIFEGVRIDTLLDAVCADAGTLRAIAINEYEVGIPLDDRMLEGALIAYRRNGAPMTLREKGPLWIVFPWDQDDSFRNEAYYSRSVWQLDRIEVIE
ncbi:hypothetical protein SAMN04488020_102185 [Palleronia marisminoris]|uniref:Oxidoreductase molybdopterin binding domain protein n=1 Tax=Palleronia marisminoris TaxID=315423 RepID=A0A1Y5S1R3_9RHOB|nr:molybdopterin-dependent oxidoreductase [Palleronia marisminoris]SFG42181.1 hypothetical protein SAMN04488020_102185 [Palleronia marisminoris]SLN27722.1 Oxidoreductase molybdopterin binding domain protein [Palleronia marisminoris]